MVLIFKYLFPGNYVGLSLWPVIFLKDSQYKNDEILLNHERIHLRQQLELGIVLFYLWYLTEWLLLVCRYRNARLAYRNISFEKEAYANEGDLRYLKERKAWNFLRYYP